MATELWPSFLPTPEQDGYRLRRGKEFVSIRLDGGRSRVRRDILGASHIATCTFVCTPEEYTALTGFLRETVRSRTELFRLPLLIDAPVAVNHLCCVLDDPEELARTRGYSHTVQVTLEVIPNPIKTLIILDGDADQRVIDAGPDAEMAEFPEGREVLLTGCVGTVEGLSINLDGTYTIDDKPDAATIVLTDAASVNAGWTTLNGTTLKVMLPTNRQGACILLPE